MAYDTTDDTPSRDEIEKETDTALLLEWHNDMVDLTDALKCQLEVNRDHPDIMPENWWRKVIGKVAYCSTAVRRIERRLLALGADLPLTVDRQERETIRRLRNTIFALRARCKDGGIDTSDIY